MDYNNGIIIYIYTYYLYTGSIYCIYILDQPHFFYAWDDPISRQWPLSSSAEHGEARGWEGGAFAWWGGRGTWGILAHYQKTYIYTYTVIIHIIKRLCCIWKRWTCECICIYIYVCMYIYMGIYIYISVPIKNPDWKQLVRGRCLACAL